MDDDLVFADSAGHLVFDIDAAREAEGRERGMPDDPSAGDQQDQQGVEA